MAEILTRLQTHGYLGMVLIDLEPLAGIEADQGRDAFEDLLASVAEGASMLRRKAIREADLLVRLQPHSEQFVIFLDAARSSETPTVDAIDRIAERVWSELISRVQDRVRPYKLPARVRIGYAVAMWSPMIQPERIVYRALGQAAKVAQSHTLRTDTRARERLRDIIIRRELSSVFQPIVELPSARVRAYEALIRGPAGTDLFSPAMLFNLATHAELVLELDRACLETTLRTALDRLPQDALLFVNVLPTLINDSRFRAELAGYIEQLGKGRLVLELNEGVAIYNYDVLGRGLNELRRAGARVAVDDLGAGNANLDHVLQLSPEFMKLDISLVRGVDQSPIKQALISSMVGVGRAVNATVIAEGIENMAEYETVSALGVEMAQGYFFARPAPAFEVPKLLRPSTATEQG